MNMQSVLVLNPPAPQPVFRDHYCSSEAKSTYLWQPLDLQIQALWLRSHGLTVTAIDAIAENLSYEAVVQRIRAIAPTHVLMLTSVRSWKQDRRMCEALREMGVKRIVASGDFLRFKTGPFQEAKQYFDWILTDFVADGLAQSIRADQPIEPGICDFDADIETLARELRKTPLDYPVEELPVFGFKRYRLPYPGFHTAASVLTSFGCTYHCKFCHVGELGYKLRAPEHIVRDFEAAARNGATCVYVRDAMINGKPEHATTWMQALIEQKNRLPWAAFMTVRPAPEELIRLAAESGCEHIQIGVETLNQDLRKDNGKAISNAHTLEMIERCHRHGIEVTAHIVLGMPGETEETLEQTYQNIHRYGFDYVALNLAEHRPGIPWDKQNRILPVLPDGNSSPELEMLQEWQRKIYRRFYLRPSRLAREGIARLKTGDFQDALSLTASVTSWLKS